MVMDDVPENPLIRRARPDEAAEISQVAFRSKAYWGYDDTFMELFREELTISPEQIVSDAVFVLEADGQIAGFAHLRPGNETTIELVSLFIDTWAIRRGFGRMLWDHALAYAGAEGFTALTLESDPNAEDFYRRLGAVDSGKRESDVKPGRVLTLMTIPIQPDKS